MTSLLYRALSLPNLRQKVREVGSCTLDIFFTLFWLLSLNGFPFFGSPGLSVPSLLFDAVKKMDVRMKECRLNLERGNRVN